MEAKPNEVKKNLRNNAKYRFISREDSDRLKTVLGGSWYQDFIEEWKRTFPKDKSIPARATAGNVINGRHSNKRIMQVIYQMAKSAQELKNELSSILNQVEKVS